MGKSFKNVGSRLILTLAAALTLVLMTAFPTKAASKPSPITELKQIDDSSTSVEVSWSCLGGSDTRYKVEVSRTAVYRLYSRRGECIFYFRIYYRSFGRKKHIMCE